MVYFFIVNKQHDTDFIEKVASEFIEQGVYYHFYGKYEPIWHLAFDDADIARYPDSKNVAMTCGYNNLEEFADELYDELQSGYSVQTDVLLFYDDEEEYHKLENMLASFKKMTDSVIMTGEPIPGKTPTDVRNYFFERKAEKDIAESFAITSNKFWWVEDNEYDYEIGTPEHIAACAITDEWRALMYEYEERIYAILRAEGMEIPTMEKRNFLKQFMERNGYIDGAGWWVKSKGSK